jgi:hypothetical protein
MNSFRPIRIALNMHGDSGANLGYFYFHHEIGTSPDYAEDEKYFISLIRNYWPEGIADWDYVVSWTDGNPMVYPESWFWHYYGESVMALTFEEIPTASRNDTLYEKTAFALLSGIADYLDINTDINYEEDKKNLTYTRTFSLSQNYPNPFNSTTNISYTLGEPGNVDLCIYDILGRKVMKLVDTYHSSGKYEITLDASMLNTGTYIYVLTTDNYREMKKMIYLK